VQCRGPALGHRRSIRHHLPCYHRLVPLRPPWVRHRTSGRIITTTTLPMTLGHLRFPPVLHPLIPSQARLPSLSDLPRYLSSPRLSPPPSFLCCTTAIVLDTAFPRPPHAQHCTPASYSLQPQGFNNLSPLRRLSVSFEDLPAIMSKQIPHAQRVRGLSRSTHVHVYSHSRRKTKVFTSGRMADRRLVNDAKRRDDIAGKIDLSRRNII
jgi:hypothetical protein